jgi:hypothetical protein
MLAFAPCYFALDDELGILMNFQVRSKIEECAEQPESHPSLLMRSLLGAPIIYLTLSQFLAIKTT